MKINQLFFLAFTLAIFSCQEQTKEEPSIDDVKVVEEEMIDSPELVEIEEVREETYKEKSERLKSEGYQIFDYVDPVSKDTMLMQQYYIAFLKRGNIRNQNEEEAAMLQEEHLAHLSKMYELGYADISGPFGDDGEIRGITIYNVPTQEMADSLANSDPMVKAGRLEIEIHPWWAGKGFPLR